MYGGTLKTKHVEFSKLQAIVHDLDRKELIIGHGLVCVNGLPFTAPWMSGLGACLINITNIRRGVGGKLEFQLGDESAKPYKAGTVWCGADDFYYEWPQ